jgi:hypothetical protein
MSVTLDQSIKTYGFCPGLSKAVDKLKEMFVGKSHNLENVNLRSLFEVIMLIDESSIRLKDSVVGVYMFVDDFKEEYVEIEYNNVTLQCVIKFTKDNTVNITDFYIKSTPVNVAKLKKRFNRLNQECLNSMDDEAKKSKYIKIYTGNICGM